MNTTNKNITTHQEDRIYDVIIAGGGPVGLLLACELALAKCSVVVLEKSEHHDSPLKQLPFGIRGLSAPTIEALDRRGLLKELEIHKRVKSPHTFSKSATASASGPQAGHFAGIPIHENNINYAAWPYHLSSSNVTHLISEMLELETVLTRRAEALGVDIRLATALTGFDQTEEGVIVSTGEQTFQGKWLVGCDGARSIVRKAGGFEFAGTEPEFTGYSTKVDIVDPEKLKPGRNLTAKGMYMQSQPGYIMIQDFDGGAYHGSENKVSREHLQEVLRRISGTDVTISALHAASTWTDRARQATSYRNGRVFLAGDAAHIHSPLGGQGLNLGLGDAMNLGWKLAASIHKAVPEGLLDSYQTERHPIGAQILDWSRAQVAIMKLDPGARAIYSILRDLMQTRDGSTYFAAKVWGIHTHYPLGSDHPLTGHNVPNFAFDDDTTIAQQMYGGQGILLDFDGDAALKKVAAAYSHQLKYIFRKAKERLGLSAVLIRPDGIVAWASDATADSSELQKAINCWFVSN